MRLRTPSGFSIIELLVVIAIMGILVSLLLPAVQMVRESARQARCSNNLKQLAMACLTHVEQRGYLPTGGWGYRWAGDPDRGFSKDQPGGWHYNILPFIELGELHKMGSNGTNQTEGSNRVRTTVPLFSCPSRRPADPYPYVSAESYYNINSPAVIGRSDYAACAGDAMVTECWGGPPDLATGDGMSDDAWATKDGGRTNLNGVIYRRSMTRFPIRDGATSTYLLGERYLMPDHYLDGQSQSDDQGWDCGYDFDVNRWVFSEPAQDTPGYTATLGRDAIFGSAHSGMFHMALCDGSVRPIPYGIDLTTHRRLGNREDNKPVDWGTF
jgi:prepilin-type N-terminal cleavage/methylation domain-containing protein